MKVYLIGAGPGDPGLLTVRGKTLLEQADVIVYDYLAAPELLTMARPGAEHIYVGKKAGAHALSQAGINSLLIAKAREGKTVARLKGGDPYIFGRGGEEAEALLDAGIAFEEVPGISSTVAGPAYAGIPLTHRALASSVTIITGHEDAEKIDSVHDWPALARSASTLVFVMGMQRLPQICAKLMQGGLSPDTPAAVIHWATTPRHRSLAATLADLPAKAQEQGFTNPSIIVVGEVVRLHDKLNWFERKPLLGKRIVVTRAREQASDLAAGLTEQGAQVLQFPVIAVRPLKDSVCVDAAIAGLASFHWLVLTSVNAVRCFWDRLAALGKDSRALANCRVAAVGPATAEALNQRGIRADVVPARHVAEDLAAALVACGMQGQRVLLPRALVGRDVLPERLTAAGAQVDVVPVYETVPVADGRDALLEALQAGDIDSVCFASSSAVDNFFAQIDPVLMRAAGSVCFACIGPVTAATLAQYGFSCHVQPASATIPALIDALCAPVCSSVQECEQ